MCISTCTFPHNIILGSRIKDEDSVCVSEVDAQATCSGAEEKDVAVWVLTEHSHLNADI